MFGECFGAKTERLRQSSAHAQVTSHAHARKHTYAHAHMRTHAHARTHAHIAQLPSWRLIAFIVKSGDDLRQEHFALQALNTAHHTPPYHRLPDPTTAYPTLPPYRSLPLTCHFLALA